jgi:hypothetical protein
MKLIEQLEEEKTKLFERSVQPLWEIIKFRQVHVAQDSVITLTNLSSLMEYRKRDILDYYASNETRIYLALLYMALIQILFLRLRILMKRAEFREELDTNQLFINRLMDHNWLTAMICRPCNRLFFASSKTPCDQQSAFSGFAFVHLFSIQGYYP